MIEQASPEVTLIGDGDCFVRYSEPNENVHVTRFRGRLIVSREHVQLWKDQRATAGGSHPGSTHTTLAARAAQSSD